MQYVRNINIEKLKASLSSGKAALLYVSAVCFLILVAIISFSVNRFINDTLSISLSAPEEFSQESQTSEIFVKQGDTLSKILYRQDIPVLEVQDILDSVKKLKNELTLQVGQRIAFDYETAIKENEEEDLIDETQTLRRIVITIDKTRSIEILRSDAGFVAAQLEIPLKRLWMKSSAVVKSSFMGAARSLGISNSNVVDLVNIYSHQIDFQRQVQPGDNLDVVIEKYTTEDGQFSHYGKVLFASLNLSGKQHNIYRYSHDNSDNMQYFTEEGKSVKRNLLRTPIGVARLSSHFGKRKHPILGYTKMHKGVDFAAATGTPIYAAGDGTVKHIGWKQGYGKCVEIRHTPTLSTFYAHASAFAKGLKHGGTVKQGQTIAFVGSSGRTTGAHLHYEVKINGQHINPLSVKTSPGIELSGDKLHSFVSFKKKIQKMHRNMNGEIEA